MKQMLSFIIFIGYFIWLLIYFLPHSAAYGILVPWPETGPVPPAWKSKVLTTGLPGKSLKN